MLLDSLFMGMLKKKKKKVFSILTKLNLLKKVSNYKTIKTFATGFIVSAISISNAYHLHLFLIIQVVFDTQFPLK